MPKPGYADVNLEVDPGTPQTEKERGHARPDRDTPFRILVFGDFSGRASRGILTKGARRPIAVDRDNFEDLLESLDVKLRLPMAGGASLDLTFRSLDDFHPDHVFYNLEAFKKLRELRDQLDDPETFAAAARVLGINTAPAKPSRPTSAPAQPAVAESLLGGSLLDQALEVTESRGTAAAPSRGADPMQQYLSALVAPHLAPKVDSKKKEVMQMVDEATSGLMRAMLHHPFYQELEANWRALYFLIKELETGPQLKVYLLDISRQELEGDIANADDLRASGMYKVLVEQTVRTPGADPWAVIIGALTFGPEMTDLNLLGRLGLMARQAGAPLLANASPKLLGCDSLAKTPYPEDWKPGAEREGWDLIRSLPEARYIGLALPRFMLRLPYGKAGEACERFEFEEMPPVPVHRDYLWGNPAFVCAYLLGQNFAENGWAMDDGEMLSMHRLPMHVYKEGGEAKMTPCAEVFLTQTAMEKIHDCGLMTLMCVVNSDEVRLAGFRSAAADGSALRSRWG
jgi:type VI secretion system protein ImpC